MKLRNLLACMVASAMALVSCVEEVNFGMPKLTLGATEASFGIEGGDTTLTINATRDWSVVLDEETAKWIAVNPASGMASLEPQNVMVTVLSNNGYSRQADLKFTIEMMSRSITVSQEGELGSIESLVVYENDFDKEVATQTYGSGTSWPYLDQFEGWKNQKGTGAENVSFAFKGMSARANSTSDSNYSDYAGSGNNNMFFGASAYLATHGIALGTATDFELTFGSEKYSKDNGSIFTNSEFHIWLSADGKKWVELKDYTFAGGETEGRWNVATANFSVPEGTATLSICISVDVASSYRMDDMKLVVSDKTGTAIDFSKAAEKEFGAPANPTPGTPSDTDAIYSNNFDASAAAEGDKGWPYLDQSDVWKNEAGSGAANVSYASSGVSVRNNANSNGSYSDYAGSGVNNIFFGKSPYFAVKNIALGGATNLELTFGTEKYSKDNGSLFTNSEFHIWLSADGNKWVEFTDYTYAGGTTEGRWNLAKANLTVPAGTENLSICFAIDVASSYRIDDLKLVSSTTAGTAVDFSQAVEKDFNAGATGGGNNDGGNDDGGNSSDADAIYNNNFDASAAAEGEKGWPYLDQSEVWKNEAGSGAANVSYASSGVSVRNNANSDGSYSDYPGSGMNNIFFGKSPYFAVKNIALGGATNLELTFGTEKYSKDNGSLFTNSEFHIWLSADGNKWVEFTDYTYAGGTTEGRWNLAKANFTVPAGTANLSICFAIDVASSYRIDDLKLVSSTTAGTAVDFSQAVEKDFNAGATGGGNNEGGNTGGGNTDDGGNDDSGNTDGGEDDGTEGTQSNPYSAAKAHEVAATLADGENITGVYVQGVVKSITEISTQFGNATYYITDADGAANFYIYRGYYVDGAKFTSADQLRVGDKVVLCGDLMNYKGNSPQLGQGSKIVELTSAGGSEDGGNDGGDDVVTPPADDDDDNTDADTGYEPNITWTLGEKAYDNTSGQQAQTATVNGVEVSNLLKLGTGSLVGDATLHVPAGTKKLGFYCVAWKGKTASVKFSIGGTEVTTITPKANAGATGNPPYVSITVTDADYFEVEMPSTAAADVKVETLDPANGRVLFIGMQAIK